MKAGGCIYLYFDGYDPTLLEETGMYRTERFLRFSLCSLRVTNEGKLRAEAHTGKGKKAARAGGLVSFFIEFRELADDLLGRESSEREALGGGNRQEAVEAAALCVGQLEKMLEEFFDDLENPELLYLADQMKSDLILLLLIGDREETHDVSLAEKLESSVNGFCRLKEREFYLSE